MTPAVKALVERQMREDDEQPPYSCTLSIPQWPYHDSEDSPQISRRSISLILFTVEPSSIVYSPAELFLNCPSISSKRTSVPFRLNGTVFGTTEKVVPFRTVFLKTER